MSSLRLETVLVGDVRHFERVAFQVGVLVLSLRHLGFQVGLAGVLQETLFFGGDLIRSFVTGKKISLSSSWHARKRDSPPLVGSIEIDLLLLPKDRDRFRGGSLGCSGRESHQGQKYHLQQKHKSPLRRFNGTVVPCVPFRCEIRVIIIISTAIILEMSQYSHRREGAASVSIGPLIVPRACKIRFVGNQKFQAEALFSGCLTQLCLFFCTSCVIFRNLHSMLRVLRVGSFEWREKCNIFDRKIDEDKFHCRTIETNKRKCNDIYVCTHRVLHV